MRFEGFASSSSASVCACLCTCPRRNPTVDSIATAARCWVLVCSKPVGPARALGAGARPEGIATDCAFRDKLGPAVPGGILVHSEANYCESRCDGGLLASGDVWVNKWGPLGAKRQQQQCDLFGPVAILLQFDSPIPRGTCPARGWEPESARQCNSECLQLKYPHRASAPFDPSASKAAFECAAACKKLPIPGQAGCPASTEPEGAPVQLPSL